MRLFQTRMVYVCIYRLSTAVSSEFDVAVGKGKSVQWPARTHGAAGNEGVAGIIRSTEYTIGYVELAYAFQTGMSYAYVQNGDGTAFVEPTLDSISAASQNVAQALPEPLVNTPGDNSYPIASFTYLLVYDEISKTTKSKEQHVRHYVDAQAIPRIYFKHQSHTDYRWQMQ